MRQFLSHMTENSELNNKISTIKLKKLIEIQNLTDNMNGTVIRIRGFIESITSCSSQIFILLRDRLEKVQCIIFKSTNVSSIYEFSRLKKLPLESFIEIEGQVVFAEIPIKRATKQNIEIVISTLNILGPVVSKLPFQLKDCKIAGKESDTNTITVGYNLRLDNRFLDFRLPVTQSIIKIIDQTMYTFRTYLRTHEFIEIKTSKIIQSGSEGGANLFSLNYFNKPAYLAQSPQLYKQLAIIGGLKRVYEIGHVYRAEVSNINRYLSEFVGLDIEMEMETTYIDFIHFLHSLFINIFESFKNEMKKELEIIRQYYEFVDLKYRSTPIIITYKNAVDMLKSKNIQIDYGCDFSREHERILGKIIKDKEDIDIFTIIDYPSSIRAFYSYIDETTKLTKSYDFIVRGEEILSGAQRENRYDYLKNAVIDKGLNPENLKNYLEAFKYGAPPHIGCGIGLERFLKAYFGFDDIRYFSLFPRDPNRIFP